MQPGIDCEMPEPGIIFEFGDAGPLLVGAHCEGHSCDVAGGFDDRAYDTYHSETFQARYSDVLTSILLGGTAEIVVNERLAAGIFLEDLLSEGIARLVPYDGAEKYRSNIARLYGAAFEACRRIERYPLVGSVVYLMDLDLPALNIDLEVDLEEAVFHTRQLRALVDPVVQGVEALFAQNLAREEEAVFGVLAALAENIAGEQHLRPGNETRIYDDTAGLYDLMGLSLNPYLWFDNEVTLNTYRPEDLKIATYGRSAVYGYSEDTEPGSGGEWLLAGMSLWARDNPVEFLRTHAFWVTFFEFVSVLERSKSTLQPVFAPGPQGCGAAREEHHSSPEDLMKVYRLFLSEMEMLPRPSSIVDLIRLREDRALTPLRAVLQEWAEIGKPDEDPRVIAQVRKDIKLAARDARRARAVQGAGRVVTYLGLPVAVADVLRGTAVGLGLAPVGVALELSAAEMFRRVKWLRFGSEA